MSNSYYRAIDAMVDEIKAHGLESVLFHGALSRMRDSFPRGTARADRGPGGCGGCMTPAEHAQDFIIALMRLAPVNCEVSITTTTQMHRVLSMRWRYRSAGKPMALEISESIEGRDYRELLESVEAQVDAAMRASAEGVGGE